MIAKNSKKYLITIFLLTFFWILGFSNVNAYSSTCYYGQGNSADFVLHINNMGGLTGYGFLDETNIDWYNSSAYDKWVGFGEYKMKNNDTLEFRNWGAVYEGFSGAKYYVNTKKAGKSVCPPVAYYIEYKTEHTIILGDGSKQFYEYMQTDLIEDEYTLPDTDSGAGGFISSSIDFVGDFVSYCFDEATGSTQQGGAHHLTTEYTLVLQKYHEEPDPVKEEIVDDGTEREWVNPHVNTINPLDEDNLKYSCGNGMLTGIPAAIPKFGKFLYNFLQFLVPIALVILGTIDLVKSITGGKEDDIKKHQLIFVKRLVAAFLVFFSFAIIKLILSVVAEDSAPIIQCTDCIMRNSANCIVEN